MKPPTPRSRPTSWAATSAPQAGLVWNGSHPEDGEPLEVIQGSPPGVPYPDLPEELQLNAPGADGFDPEMFADVAKRMGLTVGPHA